LAAGLAHEINNPAAAAARSVSALDTACVTLLSALRGLAEGDATAAQFSAHDEEAKEASPQTGQRFAEASQDKPETGQNAEQAREGRQAAESNEAGRQEAETPQAGASDSRPGRRRARAFLGTGAAQGRRQAALPE